MNSFLLVIEKTLLLFNSFCAFYLWILAFFGIKVRHQPKTAKLNRFAIVVPAHNEAHVIKTIVESLRKLDYPKDLFDCYFGADHCSDETAKKIRENGYICYEKNDGLKGKGRTLVWLTNKILTNEEKCYDAICYFDADSYIDCNFLKVMNNSLNVGNKIIQGYVGILNWNSSIFSVANQLNFVTINRLKQNGRTNAGLSCHLHGLGMCFKDEVLREFEWPVDSVTEDQQLLINLIMSDKKVVWEHEAKLYAKMPTTMKASQRQRMRWSVGKNNLLQEKALPLLKKMLHKFNFTTLDTFIEFLMPPNSFLVGLSIFNIVFAIIFLRNLPFVIWWSLLITAAYIMYFLLGAVLEKVSLLKTLKCFLISPFLIFWRMWIYLLSFRKVRIQEWR